MLCSPPKAIGKALKHLPSKNDKPPEASSSPALDPDEPDHGACDSLDQEGGSAVIKDDHHVERQQQAGLSNGEDAAGQPGRIRLLSEELRAHVRSKNSCSDN